RAPRPVPMSKSPAIAIAACLVLGAACKRAQNGSPTLDPSAEAAPAISLPDAIAGFSAGALQTEASAVRRRYTRSGVDITVTLARLPKSPEQYREWVKTS